MSRHLPLAETCAPAASARRRARALARVHMLCLHSATLWLTLAGLQGPEPGLHAQEAPFVYQYTQCPTTGIHDSLLGMLPCQVVGRCYASVVSGGRVLWELDVPRHQRKAEAASGPETGLGTSARHAERSLRMRVNGQAGGHLPALAGLADHEPGFDCFAWHKMPDSGLGLDFCGEFGPSRNPRNPIARCCESTQVQQWMRGAT